MKLEKLAAVAEIVSSIAIVATLAYLAIQTQQNASATRASVRQGMVAEETQLLLAQLQFPFINAEFQETIDLTLEQKVQVQSWVTAFLRVRESHWLQFQAGVIDEATWQAYRLPIRIVLGTAVGSEQWELRRGRGEFDPGFVEDVDRLLAQGR